MSRSGRYEPNGIKHQNKFRWLKISGIVLISILIVGSIFFFVFKNDFLRWAIEKAKHRVHQKYKTTLAINEYAFTSFNSVQLSGISLKPIGSDTLLRVNQVKVSVKILPLFVGQIRLNSLTIDQSQLSLVRYDSSESNYKNFIQKDSDGDTSDHTKDINIGKVIYKTISRLMAQIPSDFDCKQSNISFRNIDKDYTFDFDQVSLNDEELKASFGFKTPSDTQECSAAGQFSPSEMTALIKLKSRHADKMFLPVVDEKYHLKLGANEVELKLDEVDYSGDELYIKCFASYRNLLINHKRLSDHDINIGAGSGDFHFVVGENYIALDSSSSVTVNKISVNPYFRYQRAPFKLYSLKLKAPRIAAQDFFNSLPDGMFESLNGIRADGFLTYQMHCELNDTNPWNVDFDSELIPENFKIRSWGAAYLPKLNGSFTYTPYEYGRPQRPIEVGEENPSYTSMEGISSYIKNAILTSEDPSFYSHKGFVMESVRSSIAQNYVTKRFARGASTISMQLVKNIFLSRKKTLTRKFEEMLLVWMIENLNVSSKHRMFEVYLNIIEWGPGIYGIGEASNFYFRKTPADITLPEAIYLAAIIPRPKGFMWNFNDTTGGLKPHMEKYIKNISRIMAGRRLLDESDTAMFNPEIRITGPAKNYLRKYKNIPDSTDDDELQPADDWDIKFPENLELK